MSFRLFSSLSSIVSYVLSHRRGSLLGCLPFFLVCGVCINFGCLSPPLAIFVGLCIASKTYTKQVIIGRRIPYCKQNEASLQPIKILKGVSRRIAFAISDHAMLTSPSSTSLSSQSSFSIAMRNQDSFLPSSLSTDTDNSSENKVYLEFYPVDCLNRSCKGMWRSPLKCAWLLIYLAIPFYLFMTLDIAGTNDFNVINVIWITILAIAIPIGLYLTRHITRNDIYQVYMDIHVKMISGDEYNKKENNQQQSVTVFPPPDGNNKSFNESKLLDDHSSMNSSFSTTYSETISPLQPSMQIQLSDLSNNSL